MVNSRYEMNDLRLAMIRRWFKWTCLGAGTALAIAVAAGAAYEFLARQSAIRDFPARGRLVAIGGRRIHIDCRGTGTPIAVLESGLDTNGSISWSAIHDQVAQFTRACAYDRAGIMWSDPSSGPRDADAVATDLHDTLVAAQESGPYVMVGHSMGGPYIMTFTKLFGAAVVGLVFVDASHPDQVTKMQEAGLKSPGPSLRLRLMAALAWTGLPRILMPASDPKDPELIRKIAVHFWPTSLGPVIKEAQSTADTLREAGAFRSLRDRPLVVLTALAPLNRAELDALHISEEQGQRVSSAWLALQNDEASWSHQSVHEVFRDSTHYIQFDRPDAVIAAIRDVVNRTRGLPSERSD
jgi:pimeloyl-ACP methyl ester carboxylesterase